MSRHWLNRLLLSYLPVFFVITLLLLTITALGVSEQSRKAAEQANEASVTHALSLLDNSLKAVDDAIMKEIQTNRILKQYYYPAVDANSYHSVYEPSNLLHSLMTGIQSIRIDSVSSIRSRIHSQAWTMTERYMSGMATNRQAGQPLSWRSSRTAPGPSAR